MCAPAWANPLHSCILAKLPQAVSRGKFFTPHFVPVALISKETWFNIGPKCQETGKRRNPSIHIHGLTHLHGAHPFSWGTSIFMGHIHFHGAHPFSWGSDWPFKRFSFTLNTNCHTLLGAWVTGLYVGWLGWAHMLREAFCSFRRACGRQVFAPLFPRQGESGYYNTHTHTNSNTFTFLFQTHFFDTVIYL